MSLCIYVRVERGVICLKNIKTVLLLIVAVFFLSSYAWAQKNGYSAILPVQTGTNVKNWWVQYNWGSNFDPGEAVSAALNSRLSGNSKYVFVDSNKVGSIIGSRYRNAVLTDDEAVRLGKSTGARYVVKGNITEFDLTDDGRINIPIGDIKIGFGSKGEGKVRILCGLDVLDVATGSLVGSVSSRRELSFNSSVLGSLYDRNDFKNNGNASSVLGKGIYEVVDELASQLDRLNLNYGVESYESETYDSSGKLSGYIVDVDRNRVYINLSARDGLSKNDVLYVMKTERIRDPKTGRMTTIDKIAAELKVLNIGRNSSECKVVSRKNKNNNYGNKKYGSYDDVIKRGDRVVRK